MDKILQKRIDEKINETFSKSEQLSTIINSLSSLSSDQNSFAYGLVIGRLYNSFYYQCRRLLKRDPTNEEFSEFIELLKNRESEFLENLNLK